jgi:aminoglycoside/choline kinase family phosphotransferase
LRSDAEIAREAAKAAFLAEAGLSGAARTALPGDASTRRYERLRTPQGASLMLMDAPPSSESPPCDPAWTEAQRTAAGWNAMARLAASRIEAFAAAAGYLSAQGLSAPVIHALDIPQGLAVVEDFGGGVFADLMAQGADERPFYMTAVETVARLHDAPPPPALEGYGASWPLLDYDALALKAGADLFVQWWPSLHPQLDFTGEARAEWDALWAPIVARAAAGASVFSHRDYHAENLIWLGDRQGTARAGLLDFQDALRAHPSWDLHSLLQDARRDVSPALEAAALDHYFTLRPPQDREAFLADYAALASLNEARIIGIFARLIVRDGKPRYGAFLPRMWRQLERNLGNPQMAGLKAWFDRHVPPGARTPGSAA